MTFKPTHIVLITAALLGTGCSGSPADSPGGYSGVVEGIIQDSTGQPLSGAFVKLQNAERRLTFMVISQDQGHYTAGQLPAGSYILQGVGNGVQSEWSSPLEVIEGGSVKLDLSLTDPQAPMLPAAWPRRLPEEQLTTEALPEGPGRELISTHCISCHGIARVFRTGRSRQAWQATIDEMRTNIRDGGLPDLTEEEAELLTDYTAAHFRPLPTPDENSRFPRTLLQGEARNYRVVQHELENVAADTHDVAVDPFGIGWANQRDGGKVSRFDPETLEHTEISPPLTTAGQARPGNPQISEEGVMWLPEPAESRWLSYDIQTAQWTSWDFPDSIRGGANGNSMALHQDGTIWLTGPGALRRLDPTTHQWSNFDTPTWTQTHKNPGGYGITVAGDGRVWFALQSTDLMARVDPETGAVDEFEIPVEGIVYPRRMDTDREGNVWVALWQAGKIMKIDQHTAEMTVFDAPNTHNGAYSISIDQTSDFVWVTLHRVDKIARFNPNTLEWLEFPLPQAETDVRRIELDPNNPDRLWWSSSDGAGVARIGFIELLDD
ncbi:MAG: carboxypeptidase regulatory-like domain-containing protein [Acidobacteriota bacterium]